MIIADDINEVFTEDFDSSDLINSENKRRKSPTPFSSNSKHYSSGEKPPMPDKTEEKENDKAFENECPAIGDSPRVKARIPHSLTRMGSQKKGLPPRPKASNQF